MGSRAFKLTALLEEYRHALHRRICLRRTLGQ